MVTTHIYACKSNMKGDHNSCMPIVLVLHPTVIEQSGLCRYVILFQTEEDDELWGC